MTGKDKFLAKSCNAQYVETGICFRLSDTVGGATGESTLHVAPALEITGSRFPFFAPTTHDLACDLCGCIGVVEGKPVLLSPSEYDLLLGYHFVLTCDGEPTEIGSGKLFEGNPLNCLQLAQNYAEQLGFTLNSSHFVLCSSLSPQSPVRPGVFEANWGKFGKVHCTII
ncbi:4-oxalocrotonate decarboxylase [Strigomonas culicis]|nr:4-oxalocrotonate decarboxylase [Strigomonas culicis]|eukprot:EPY25799.1 4-oxalocrotonate decarboxylase [Strigomonas culicis]